MTRPAIHAEGVSKRYVLGGPGQSYATLRDSLVEAVRRPFRGASARGEAEQTFWALRDVGFEVQPGEVVGVIGRNGAGKSTLLKILSRITEPTEGRIAIRGRVSSLLEVGTGFHPELTGRENAILSGAILGMSRREVLAKLDSIAEFAEVERFLDTPVKRYSSGMYLRLAFAVAAHLDPEILIIDEVLAVGDAAFQKKCLGKMGEAARSGRTVLFVSHNMTAVQSLCSRTFWLDGGRLAAQGETREIVSRYLSGAFSALTDQTWSADEAPTDGNVRLLRAAVRPGLGAEPGLVTVRTPLELEFEYETLVPDLRLNLSLFLRNEEGLTVFNSAPVFEPRWHGHPFPLGRFRSVCPIPADLLNDGTYTVDILVVKDQSVVLFPVRDLLAFEVHDDPSQRGGWYGKWEGAVRPRLEWRTDWLEEAR